MKKTALLSILSGISIFANAQVPQLLKDINPGISNGVISTNMKMINYNGTTYFQAQDANDNVELWKTDGTPGGTFKIKEINPTVGSNPHDFFVFNNKLFFGANDGVLGDELYSSDGTANGTALFKQLYDTTHASESSIPSDFFEYDGKMFVWGHEFSEDPTKDLWSSDGTIAGTTKAGFTVILPSIIKNINFNNTIVFDVFASIANINQGLIRTDFTATGTSLLVENTFTFSTMDIAKVDNSKFVYLISPVNTNTIELWSSEGTPLGDTLIATWQAANNILDGGFTNFNGEVYFFKNIGTSIELWKTKGTLATTHLVKTFTTSTYPLTGNQNPIKLVELNNKLYFNMADSLNQSALWMTDGTTTGTSPIAFFENETINQSTYLGLSLNNALVYNDKMYFIAKNSLGWETWVSDGTATGTGLIYDLATGSASSVSSTQPYFFSGHNDKVYFVANDLSSGDELFYINVSPPLTINDNDINDLSNQINIYPNPSNGMFTLANNSLENVSVQIMNMLGETVYSNNGIVPTESKTVDLSRFAKGVYAVDVISNKGASKKKIVMQ